MPDAAADAEARANPTSASDAGSPAPPVDLKAYAWLAEEPANAELVEGTLLSRFETPPGYQRVAEQPGTFGAWLRNLPLARPGTPVTDYKGQTVRSGDDEYMAAVVPMDLGNADLQQSPDAVLRLHAEWAFSIDAAERLRYRGSASNRLELPFSRWLKGERLVPAGGAVFWAQRAKPSAATHAELRAFLSSVFTWANSTSVAAQAARVSPEQVRPGDFFLHSRAPGHAAIILDIAQKPSGERLALLGQALNPAQSIHVLRPGRKTAWFSLRPPKPVITPYTSEFDWSELRRMPAPQ